MQSKLLTELVDDGDDVGIRKTFRFALDLGVADGGFQQAKRRETVGVPGQHGGLEFLRHAFEQCHAVTGRL